MVHLVQGLHGLFPELSENVWPLIHALQLTLLTFSTTLPHFGNGDVPGRHALQSWQCPPPLLPGTTY